ncbi:MAG: hypothetical protein KGJ93_01785 [Patescibacteria group bacterium]|nr:hypothetical protein [Patescibacteria group bacterium]
MQLMVQPQNLDSGQSMKFTLRGFPEEPSVVSALQNFYRGQNQQPRQFLIYNTFDELIFSGSVNESGQVASLEFKDRRESADKFYREKMKREKED